MGWQQITRVFYGVPLENKDADRILGMRFRYEERVRRHKTVVRGVGLPDDPEEVVDRNSPGIAAPLEEQAGRLWVGVQVGEWGGALPEDRQEQVWPASAPEVRGVMDVPATPSRSVVARWEHFVGWCKRRGVDLPPAGLYVVADYD